MTPRSTLLGILAAAVLLAGVYLFHEVRATPRAPEVAAAAATTGGNDEVAPSPARAEDHKWTAAAPHPTGAAAAAPAVPAGGSDEESTDDTVAALDKPNPKLDAIMDQANKHYDRGEWEDAKAIAAKVLARQPTNVRMMRIMVSASCVDGDSFVAQKWFDQLPKPDREQMKVRCDKYGVTFKDGAQ